MLHSRRVAWFVAWFVLAGVCGCAQDTVSPLPGTLLRVTAPTLSTDRIIGTLVQSTEGELVLDLPPGVTPAAGRALVS